VALFRFYLTAGFRLKGSETHEARASNDDGGKTVFPKGTGKKRGIAEWLYPFTK
jgi:hypothetical protein